MHKKIALFLSIIFNLSIYSQVVIKDEIVLDDTGIYKGTESVSLVMPFYGRVYSEIPCQWNHWTSGAIKITRTAGGQTQLDGCWPPFVCGNGSCFCSWGTRAHNFYGVAQGENISVEISRCYDPPPTPPNDAQWFDVPLQFNYVGNNRYDLYGQDIADGSWDYIGYFKFISTNPPGNCSNAGGNYCDSSSWVEVPNVELVPYPNSNVILTWCSEHPNTIAAFGPAIDHPSNINTGEINESNVIACYNQILQTWQFNLNQNLKLYYQIGICSTNVSNKNLTYINDTTDIENIPSSDCNIALISFNAHNEYRWDAPTQTYGLNIPDGGYLIKEVILEHENQHKVLYEKFMNDYLFWWETKINTFRANCSTYNNIFDARKGGFNMYMYAYSTLITYFLDAHDRFTGAKPENKLRRDRNEKRTNNKPEVQNMISKYVKKLEKHCENN